MSFIIDKNVLIVNVSIITYQNSPFPNKYGRGAKYMSAGVLQANAPPIKYPYRLISPQEQANSKKYSGLLLMPYKALNHTNKQNTLLNQKKRSPNIGTNCIRFMIAKTNK